MKLLKEEDGQTTIFLALFMGILMFGFLALAIDVGYLFQEKRMAQAAADAAALAAAEEGGTTATAQVAANTAATLNGFNTSQATNPATVSLSASASGNYPSTLTTPPSAWVTAVVSQPVQTFFLGAINSGMRTLTVSASATAAAPTSFSDCVCLKSPSGMDLNMSNNSQFSSASCAFMVDSTSANAIGVVGSAGLCPEAVAVAGPAWNDIASGPNVNNGGSVCSTAAVVTSAPLCDPAMPAAPSYNSSQCTADPLTNYGNGATSYSIGPGSAFSTTQAGNLVCYRGGVTIGANNDTVMVNPGIYVINGGELEFKSGANGVSNLGGNGILIYLTNGASLVIDNGANVNLVAGGIGNAPNTGIYNGILVYEDPGSSAAANDPANDVGDTQAVSVQGGATAVFEGSIYAPMAAVTLGNGSGSTFDASIVAQTLTMNGGGTLSGTPSVNLGTVTAGGPSYLTQ